MYKFSGIFVLAMTGLGALTLGPRAQARQVGVQVPVSKVIVSTSYFGLNFLTSDLADDACDAAEESKLDAVRAQGEDPNRAVVVALKNESGDSFRCALVSEVTVSSNQWHPMVHGCDNIKSWLDGHSPNSQRWRRLSLVWANCP